MGLLRSEWLKLIYARANWGLLLATVLIAALSTAITPIILASQGDLFGITLQDTAGVDASYSNAISGYVFAIILGIMIMAGEFRHGTAVATFLTAPKRQTVLLAKLAIAALAGAVMMVISALLAIAAGAITLSFFDDVAAPSQDLFLNLTAASALAGAVLAVMGVSLGALIRNQMLAIVGSLIYLFIVDPLLLTLWPDAGKWLPSGLVAAMLDLKIAAPELGFDTTGYLPAITAALVLAGYGIVFAIAAVATTMKRDID